MNIAWVLDLAFGRDFKQNFREVTLNYGTLNPWRPNQRLSNHISIVFSIKLLLKLIWLKVSSAFNLGQRQQGNFSIIVMWCMTSASQWKFSSNAVSALHASLWLVGTG